MDMQEGLIHRLYPSTKMYVVLAIIVTVFVVNNVYYSLFIMAVMIGISLWAKTCKKFIGTISKTLLVLIVMMFVLQAFFYPGETILWRIGIFSIKMEGLEYALSLSSKILVTGGSIILYFMVTSVAHFIYSLEKRGLPPTIAYVFLSTIQLVPQMMKKAQVIMNAQKSRGLETEGSILLRVKSFTPVIGPLILSSIVGTEERAITLEARAFTAPVKKTSLISLEKTTVDIFIKWFVVLYMIGVIVWQIILQL